MTPSVAKDALRTGLKQIKKQNTPWFGLQGDLRKAWSNETNKNKEKILAQYSANSKSSGPVTKNQ